MSDHSACEEGGSAHILNDVTLCQWPCGLNLVVKERLGRVTFKERLWEEHEKWRETSGN